MKAITNARIYTMAGQVIERGTVSWQGSSITGVSDQLLAPSSDVFDAQGGSLLPGLINAHCQAGLKESLLDYVAGDDSNESSFPVTPQLNPVHGINPADPVFAAMLSQGITTVAVAPGSINVLGGSVAVLKTCGSTVDEMVIKNSAGIKAAIGDDPKQFYRAKPFVPQTRMNTMAMLRENFFATRDYLQAKDLADISIMPPYNAITESLAPVLEGELPLFVHANRRDDIHSALRLAREFNLKLILVNAAEAHLLAEKLAAAQVKCILSPGLKSRSKFELQELCWQAPALLSAAGVELTVVPDSNVLPANELTAMATMLRKNGYTLEQVIAMLTIKPARILNIENKVGSIEVGKNADLILYNNEPFSFKEAIKKVIVNGQECLSKGGEQVATD